MKISVPFKNQLENLFQLKCRNLKHGCTELTNYGKIQEHERICQYELIQCLNIGCQEWVVRKAMVQHKEQCKFGLEICEFCLKDVLKYKMQGHL